MHLLLEEITVVPIRDEGSCPKWFCTKPISQYAVGVWVWRRVNGAWSEQLITRNMAAHSIHRIRLVVEDWPGLPQRIELYDALGQTDTVADLAERVAQIEQLMGTIKRLSNTDINQSRGKP